MGDDIDGQIILEIGCADAEFLLRVARKHPRAGFIGLDWKYKAVHDGAARVAVSGARNIILMRARAQDVSRFFAEREIDEIWIFHPDPCAREAELKNRLIAVPFLIDAHAALRDGGSTLSLKTDHPGYYQWVLALLDVAQPDWTAIRARPRELMRAENLPPPDDQILRCFTLASHSADLWNDPAAMARASTRLFADERTAYEAKFVAKRRPIYYVELRKRD
jgi:tRNA G46 methylase TrmB